MAFCKYKQATKSDSKQLAHVLQSLKGMFDVNMPLLYCEEKRAFQRLHENIVNSTNDTSMFYWILPPIIYGYNYHGVLGQAPHLLLPRGCKLHSYQCHKSRPQHE